MKFSIPDKPDHPITTGLLGLLTGAAIAAWLLYEPPPPFELISLELLTPVLGPDSMLRARIKVQWNEKCDAVSDRFVFKANDPYKTLLWRQTDSAVLFNEGTHEWTGQFYVPIKEPGDYVYRARWTGNCKNGKFPMAIPDQYFKIIAENLK